MNQEESLRQAYEVVAIATHELRTPLTAIKGYASLLEAADLSPQERSNALAVINDQTDHLIRVIEDMLSLANLEAGHLPVQVSSFSLWNQMQRLVDLLRPKYPRHQVSMAGEDRELRSDEDRVEQVLINLVDNACKYSPPASYITLSAHRVGDRTEVRVHNDGPPLSEQEQQELFQKFSRLERNRDGIRGSGLGLYIAHKLVEHLGGELWVESSPGKGVTFAFSVPDL